MSDILSSASLLLAILTTVFGLIYPTIKEVLDLKVAPHKADNSTNYKKSLLIRRTRLVPLLIGSIILSLIFIPELIKQIAKSLNTFFKRGFAFNTYDTVMASFIVVALFMITLTIIIIAISIEYQRKVKALSPS